MYPKPFLCPNGHTLGEVSLSLNRKSDFRIRRLSLYRHADQPDDIIAVITGPADEITCSICGYKRDWFIGDEGIQSILDARNIPQ